MTERTDTERLDWLERTGEKPGYTGRQWFFSNEYGQFIGNDLRGTIDAAMEAKP